MAGITLRDLGLRIHRWLGLVVGLLAIALALSGAVLACAPLIGRIAAPARYRISGKRGSPPAPMQRPHTAVCGRANGSRRCLWDKDRHR